MSKHSGKIGLYLLLIVALIAGYLYLNDQVSTQGSYTMGQLEKALEEEKAGRATANSNCCQSLFKCYWIHPGYGHDQQDCKEKTNLSAGSLSITLLST